MCDITKHMCISGTWSGKDVHPQERQAPLCWCQKHHLLCPSQTGADGHHSWECLQVCFLISHALPFCNLCKAEFEHCCPGSWTTSEDKLHSSRDFHILFVPRRSILCEQRLREQGVLASFINIDEYILDLIPYDGDLLSMEYESAFRVCTSSISVILLSYKFSKY